MPFKTFVAKPQSPQSDVDGITKYHRIRHVLSDTAIETYCGLVWTFSLYKAFHSDKPSEDATCRTCERKYATELAEAAKYLTPPEPEALAKSLSLAQVLELNPGAIEGIIKTSVGALDFDTKIELTYRFGRDRITVTAERLSED